MSFRKEIKYTFDDSKYFLFKKWLNVKEFKINFPKRQVTSLYFDNKNFNSYKDSIEGTVPRKKIRIRYYGEQNNESKYYLEEKISSVEGRFKKTREINKNTLNKFLRYGIKDSSYGNCKMKKIITYERSYFNFKNIRLTFDEKIKYKNNLNSKLWRKINKYIFEIKTDHNSSEDYLNDLVPFQKIRFSKYCESF